MIIWLLKALCMVYLLKKDIRFLFSLKYKPTGLCVNDVHVYTSQNFSHLIHTRILYNEVTISIFSLKALEQVHSNNKFGARLMCN